MALAGCLLSTYSTYSISFNLPQPCGYRILSLFTNEKKVSKGLRKLPRSVYL